MTTETAVAVREPRAIDQVREALEVRLDEIDRILPPGMDAARFVRVSLLALSKNPRLLEADRTSVVMSIIEAAQVGLEPTGGVGGAHLVPFRTKQGMKAQLIYDYRGIQHLIREGGGGEVKTVLVYDGDHFEVHEGTQPRIEHRPGFESTAPDEIKYVYAWPLDHPDKFEVMTKDQIDAVRARSRAANEGPWVTDYGAMARKTVLKRLSAWLPLKPATRQFLQADTDRELGVGLDEPTETVKSRTAEVRERVLANSGKRRTAQDAPGSPETPETPPDAPSDSADQRTAENETEGDVREVCGETTTIDDESETCVLEPGHLADGLQLHKAASGSVWPAVSPKREDAS